MIIGEKIRFRICGITSHIKTGNLIKFKNFPFRCVLTYPDENTNLFWVSEYSTGCYIAANGSRKGALMDAYSTLLAHKYVVQDIINRNEIINKW